MCGSFSIKYWEILHSKYLTLLCFLLKTILQIYLWFFVIRLSLRVFVVFLNPVEDSIFLFFQPSPSVLTKHKPKRGKGKGPQQGELNHGLWGLFYFHGPNVPFCRFALGSAHRLKIGNLVRTISPWDGLRVVRLVLER